MALSVEHRFSRVVELGMMSTIRKSGGGTLVELCNMCPPNYG